MLAQAGSTSPTGLMTDQTQVSVGPPDAMTRTPDATARSRSGNVTGIQSPARITRPSGASVSPVLSTWPTSMSSNAGTEFQNVTPSLRTSPAQTAGSGLSIGGGITTVPPAAIIPNTSYTDRSKCSPETARQRSSGPTSKRRLMSRIVLAAPRCSTITPLGVPVEPDV